LLDEKIIQNLKNKKNLLAFSGGGDSTALFFLLRDANVEFDIAIVDYGLREQSKDEVLYAKTLSRKYNKKCYIYNADTIEKNFESTARKIRYDFFEDLIRANRYANLLTAHHLGDRFEWMLMQFCKGAGCIEIAGMQNVEKRDSYTLVRPLLKLEKSELIVFLKTKKIKYFEDETNLDESIKRNSFRHNYSNPLLKKYKDGIKKSFNYIDSDRKELATEIEIKTINEFAYFPSSKNKRNDIYIIDRYLKSKLHIISAHERELLQNNNTVVIGRKFVVSYAKDFIFIAPYILNNKQKMSKKFKEMMRGLKIEPKIRAYLNQDKQAQEKVNRLLCSLKV